MRVPGKLEIHRIFGDEIGRVWLMDQDHHGLIWRNFLQGRGEISFIGIIVKARNQSFLPSSSMGWDSSYITGNPCDLRIAFLPGPDRYLHRDCR